MILGQSLTPSLIIPGWQGQPFVQQSSCNFGIYSNYTHNVIIKAFDSSIAFEEVDQTFGTRIVKETQWDRLEQQEKEFWKSVLQGYPSILSTLEHCGFRLPA
jgi:hypothetical protein